MLMLATRSFIRLVCLAAVAAAVLTPLAADAESPWEVEQAAEAVGEQWFRGVGVHTISQDGHVLDREVSAWVSTDRRYRIIVSSPDGSSEEVIYDGHVQRAIISPGYGEPSFTVIGDGIGHYVMKAFEGRSKAAMTSDVELARNASGDFATLDVAWTETAANAGILTPTGGAYPPVVEGGAPAGPATRSSDDRTATFSGITGPCVDAYNFRNLSTGYFRGTSTALSACHYVSVTLRQNSQSQGGGGFCQTIGYMGTSGVKTGFASKYGYTAVANNPKTCSTHDGWDIDWAQWVNGRGLNGYPN